MTPQPISRSAFLGGAARVAAAATVPTVMLAARPAKANAATLTIDGADADGAFGVAVTPFGRGILVAASSASTRTAAKAGKVYWFPNGWTGVATDDAVVASGYAPYYWMGQDVGTYRDGYGFTWLALPGRLGPAGVVEVFRFYNGQVDGVATAGQARDLIASTARFATIVSSSQVGALGSALEFAPNPASVVPLLLCGSYRHPDPATQAGWFSVIPLRRDVIHLETDSVVRTTRGEKLHVRFGSDTRALPGGDFLVGSTGWYPGTIPDGSPEPESPGAIYRVSGTTMASEQVIVGRDLERQGCSVEVLGDALLAAGQFGNNPDGIRTGRVSVYGLASFTLRHTVYGMEAEERFGGDICHLPLTSQVAVGAHGWRGVGRVYLFDAAAFV